MTISDTMEINGAGTNFLTTRKKFKYLQGHILHLTLLSQEIRTPKLASIVSITNPEGVESNYESVYMA